jgi:DNA-binding XRE family transcriptional regulator
MIKNERQHAYSKKKLKELEDDLKTIVKKYADKPNKAKLLGQGYNEHIAQIREEIAEYQRIKSIAVPSIIRAHNPEELRRRIIELRIQRGLTQADLAKRIGCKQSDISRMERKGYKGFSLTTLEKVAFALEFKIEISLFPTPSR